MANTQIPLVGGLDADLNPFILLRINGKPPPDFFVFFLKEKKHLAPNHHLGEAERKAQHLHTNKTPPRSCGASGVSETGSST